MRRARCCAARHHTLHLLAPYLATEQRRHLLTLSNAYAGEDQSATV